MRRLIILLTLGLSLLAGPAFAATTYTAGEDLAAGDVVTFDAAGDVVKTASPADVAVGVVFQPALAGQPVAVETTDDITVNVAAGTAALQYLSPSATPGVAAGSAAPTATSFGYSRTAESGGACSMQFMRYDGVAAGGGASELRDLSDVDTAGVQNEDVLGYNAANAQFEPVRLTTLKDALAVPTLPRMGDLVLYAKLAEASGARALTYGLNGPLQDNGGVTQGASLGIEANSAQFTAASSQYLSLSNANWVAQQPIGQFAGMCAFQVDTLAADQDIAAHGDAGGAVNTFSWALQVKTDGALRVLMDSNGAAAPFDVDISSAAGRIVAGVTYLVCWQWDGAHATLWSYKVGTDTQPQLDAQAKSATLAANGLYHGTGALTIGAAFGNGAVVVPVDGRIEWLTLWNRAHTAQWIDWAFNDGSGRLWATFN